MLPAAFTVLFLLVIVALLAAWIIIRQGRTDDAMAEFVRRQDQVEDIAKAAKIRAGAAADRLSRHINWHRARGESATASEPEA